MISIIMPIYNSEKYLKKTITSILSQTYQDYELIAVDDGSTDQSTTMLDSFSKFDERIHVIHQENSGPSVARNRGISLAKGDWLYFMDSDDYIEPNMFESLLAKANNNTEMIISGVIKHHVEKKERIINHYLSSITVSDSYELKEYLATVIKESFRGVFFNYLWNRLISAKVIKDNHIIFNRNIKLGEDFLFLCDTLKHINGFVVTDERFYHYCIRRSQSLVGKFYNDELSRRITMFEKLRELYAYYNLLEKCKPYLEMHEGNYSFTSLCKINYKNCVLSKKEKINYINSFLQNERKDYMVKYFKHSSGLKNHIKAFIVKTGNPSIVYFFINNFVD